MSETFTHICGASWTGKNRSHCSACHVTFGGVASFDRHRRIGSTVGRECLTPQSLGLVDNGSNIWVSKFGVEDGD
jgi:hypothetical protein